MKVSMRQYRTPAIFLIVLLVVIVMAQTSARPAPALPGAPAVPRQPQNYFGRVSINGANVSLDTLISAWCKGLQAASTLVYTQAGETWYYLDVPAYDPVTTPSGCDTGDTVSFKIGDVLADQTGTWAEGGQNDFFILTATVEIKSFLPLVIR